MNKLYVSALFFIVATLLAPRTGWAQGDGDAAFLFAYRARPGMEAAFTEGYQRHLRWHAEHSDTLAWLGWSVFAGPGLGLFVNGTFGNRFQALDARVDPRGDRADAAANVTAFADPVYRGVYRLRRDLGSSSRLEEGAPVAMQKVLRLTIHAGQVDEFEEALRTLAASPSRSLEYSVYEQIAGGRQPAFLVVVHFGAWADLEDADRDPSRAFVLRVGNAVAGLETEVWFYRPDMTYQPTR